MRKGIPIFGVAAAGLVLSCRGADSYGPQGPGGWGPMMHYGFGYGGAFMWILFLIVIGVLIYFILRARETNGPMQTQAESPLDILRKRYAKGEISKEDFDRIREDLEN